MSSSSTPTQASRWAERPQCDIPTPKKAKKGNMIEVECELYEHQQGELAGRPTGRGGIKITMPKSVNTTMEKAIEPVDLGNDYRRVHLLARTPSSYPTASHTCAHSFVSKAAAHKMKISSVPQLDKVLWRAQQAATTVKMPINVADSTALRALLTSHPLRITADSDSVPGRVVLKESVYFIRSFAKAIGFQFDYEEKYWYMETDKATAVVASDFADICHEWGVLLVGIDAATQATTQAAEA